MMAKSGVIQISIPDRKTLQACYMPAISGGGLFVCTDKKVSLGDEVFVLANLPGQSQKIPLTGKVVCISYKQMGDKPQGFAMQLSGEKGNYYKNEAEKLLAGSMSLDCLSFTM